MSNVKGISEQVFSMKLDVGKNCLPLASPLGCKMERQPGHTHCVVLTGMS
jgi:hypothetical protein